MTLCDIQAPQYDLLVVTLPLICKAIKDFLNRKTIDEIVN